MKRSRFLWLGSLLLVAITLALTACPGPTAPKLGSVAVDVTPDTVEWTIAGPADANAGITPTEKFTGDKTLDKLDPGVYTISGKAAGYKDGSTSVTVEAGKEAKAVLTLEKKPDPVTTGTLSITVSPDDSSVSVSGPNGYSTQFDGSKSLTDLKPGSYTVAAEKAGFVSASKTANVKAGETTDLSLTLAEVPEAKPVANVTITGFKDYAGQPFITRKEINASKDVNLLAAQLEDSVCFTVKVTDKDGEPVEGATVQIQPTSNFPGVRVVAFSGCGANGTDPSAIGTASLSFNKTDANGELKAYLVATYDGSSLYMYDRDDNDPTVKVLVEASNETSSAVATAGLNSAWNEFKVWFYNIAHLYRSEGGGKFTVTPARWGSSYDVIINNFVAGEENAHAFATLLMQKQPESKLFHPSAINGGFIQYVLHGADKNRVEFDNCTAVSADGLSCNDTDGAITIKPKATETLQSVSDDPIDVEVTATLYFKLAYGAHSYSFALKQYTFKKRWVADFTKLEIDKKVDHHVLTWKGSAHTLGQQKVISTDPWIATYTITVKNAGKKIAKHVTITDSIQPELGWTGEATPDGATYDSDLHQITWDVGDLAAGESVDVTFSVYARQKPGFCWQGGGYHANRPPQTGSIEANGGCESPYADPYNAINGEYKDDVTAEADDIDPVDFDPVSEGKVDQVILYVVRPLYQVDKYIKLPGGGTADFITVKEDDNVDFGFKVTTVDRSIAEAEYASLQTKYPAEFGPASDPANGKWANPYGHTLALVDWFDNGLDYDSSGSKVTWNAGTPKMVTMDGSAYALIGNKAPAAFTGADYELHLTASEPTLDRNADQVVDGWINCAYMNAGNLNQPRHDHTDAAPFLDWWDAHNQQHPWHVPDNMHQISAVAQGNPPHTTSEPAALSPNVAGNPGHPGFTITSPNNVDGNLEDCVVVYVNPREVSRILTLSTIKEHNATAAMASAAFAGAPETDPVAASSTFWYYFLVNSAATNTSSVDDIVFRTTLAGGAYTGNTRVMEAASNGGQWQTFAWTDVANAPVIAGPIATFAEYDGLAADHYLLYAVEVTAEAAAGQESITGEVTGSNAGNQADLTPVVEQTVVQ